MQIDEIKEKLTPALRKHHIKRAGVFGSIATGHADRSSDVDLLVEFGKKISLLEFVRIKYELEDLLGQQVDLAILEAFQRQGIGKKLITTLLEYGQQQGFQEIFVQAEADDFQAIDFYRATPVSEEVSAIQFVYSLA